MKHTNKNDWPEAIVKMCLNDNYVPGRQGSISVTQLLTPPQQLALRKLHAEEIEMDVDELFYPAIGSLIHGWLEQHGEGIVEQRLYAEVDGQEVSAQIDLCDNNQKLIDWKYTPDWSYILGKDEWEHQMQVQRWLCGRNGIEVKSMENWLLFRNFNRHKVGSKGYPKSKCEAVQYKIWPDDKTENFVRQKVQAYKAQMKMIETGAPQFIKCSDHDRWARGEAWAVKKKTNKRATRVCDSLDDAEKTLMHYGVKTHEIEHRPPEYVRCDEFCNVAQFCQQIRE